MGTVGQIEKRTQARIVALFPERLGYDYPGMAAGDAGLLGGTANAINSVASNACI